MLSWLFTGLAVLYAVFAGAWVGIRVVRVFDTLPLYTPEDAAGIGAMIRLSYLLAIWALPTIALSTLSLAVRPDPAPYVPPPKV